FDHTQILGSFLSQIAFEKAGIIKNSNQKVVIAPQEKEAMEVLRARCQELGINPIEVKAGADKNFELGLKGKHQRTNAQTALEVVSILKEMGMGILDTAVTKGLKNVRWPGRFELLRQSPDVIVDGAHNEASALALARLLGDEYPHRKIILILGVSEDKDIEGICRPLKDQIACVFLTKANHPRAHQFTEKDAQKYFSDKPWEIIDNIPSAIARALNTADKQGVILITGSFFVVAEARNIVHGAPLRCS
ncbi:MAG: hypothetical protein HQL13_01760, partial [Candidatus Omnitrophica bacterium]|nr:hypothetical protein [Candidatus Omnitrophota bacterium]